MNLIRSIFNKEWKITLALLLVSFFIYFLYFHEIFLNINSVLSSITSDSIKNYFTFVYHITRDKSMLHFEGMNYPYGEHVSYTDCQPLLTFVLRLLPFTHDYVIGIMHSLLYISFIITPAIIYKVFSLLSVDRLISFFISLAISLLAPQFLKINGGHFALAYGCIIPFSIFLILKYLQQRKTRTAIVLSTFHCLIFLLHPYLGLSLSLFAFLAILMDDLSGNKIRILRYHVLNLFANLLPIALFKLFMSITDQHPNRTKEPWGAETMVENLDSILAPTFGPFQPLMEKMFNERPSHFEGHTYLGFFTILLTIASIFLLPKLLRRKNFKREIVAIFLSSFILLLISFGYHTKILKSFGISASSINQFRAASRFAWFFYFLLPIFLVTSIYHAFADTDLRKKILVSVSVVFFLFNLVEAHYYLQLDESSFWKFRNIFKTEVLNEEEKTILSKIKTIQPQAILPLPFFHVGSETYERNGSDNSLIPSLIYSYHGHLPIMSGMMSRTSITESEYLIQVLNSYKKEKDIVGKLNEHDFLVLKTEDPMFPDEERLVDDIKPILRNDSLVIGTMTRTDLLKRKITKTIVTINAEQNHFPDSTNNVLYISLEKQEPFFLADSNRYQKLRDVGSNQLKPGTYVLSFHYRYPEKSYDDLSSYLIITKQWQWTDIISARKISGFYKGMALFEYYITIDANVHYEFVLQSRATLKFTASHIMIRPKTTTVYAVTEKKDTLINNFPPD